MELMLTKQRTHVTFPGFCYSRIGHVSVLTIGPWTRGRVGDRSTPWHRWKDRQGRIIDTCP